jgi:mannose-6-phosphate isomerase-like protein (cupin superfamily)
MPTVSRPVDYFAAFTNPWAIAPGRTPSFLTADEGERMDVLGQTVTVKVGARGTVSASTLFEVLCPPGVGTPPHREAGDETFFVLEGTLTFLVDDEIVHASAGDCLFVPRGVRHAESNTGQRPARALVVSTLGERKERMFAELARLAAHGTPDGDAIAAVCAAHGVTLATD